MKPQQGAVIILFFLTGCGGTSGFSDAPDTGTGYGAICSEYTQCGGETPICTRGSCVECIRDSDCPPGNPICSPDGFCGDCASNQDCTGAGQPLCDTAIGRCRECLDAGDCAAGESCRRGRCVPACATDADCNGGDICDTTLLACVECMADGDCGGGGGGRKPPQCIRGRCEQCIQNTDCRSDEACDDNLNCVNRCQNDGDCGTQYCDLQRLTCFECVQDSHCPAGLAACMFNQCWECRSDADCTAPATCAADFTCQ